MKKINYKSDFDFIAEADAIKAEQERIANEEMNKQNG